ncbi:MAG: hypothetical protein AB8H03_11510, partial [Saprospiraceae bacterium]
MRSNFKLQILVFLMSCSFFMTGQSTFVTGDTNTQRFHTVKYIGSSLYGAGSTVDGNGQIFGIFAEIDPATNSTIWVSQLPEQSSLFDFILDANEDFIVVGRTEPIIIGTNNWQNNRSIISRFDQSGLHLSTNVYEVDSNTGAGTNDGREGFFRILHNPNADNPDFPYFIAGFIDSDNMQATVRDDAIIINMDIDLNINQACTGRY